MAPKPTTLSELQSAAAAAAARLADARARLDVARSCVVQASGAHHQAIVTMTEAAVAPPPPAAGRAKTTSAAAPAAPSISECRAQLDRALADYDQVKRDLGLS